MKSPKSSEQGLLHARLGLDGWWHAVYEKSCGGLHSLASDPDRETAMDMGRQLIVDAIWPDLYPYQRAMVVEAMKAKDEGRAMIVMPGRRHGRATVAHAVNLIHSTADALRGGPRMVLVDDMEAT